MGDVETLGVELGEPGFFYPFGIWDLGLDNARIAGCFASLTHSPKKAISARRDLSCHWRLAAPRFDSS